MNEHAERDFARMLEEVGRTHMPFGKFGPLQFPPRGLPIYELPYEYLRYFDRKGFPRGRLGELLRVVYLAKRDGADAVFAPLREAAGGRVSLRRPRRRRWTFGEPDTDTPVS